MVNYHSIIVLSFVLPFFNGSTQLSNTTCVAWQFEKVTINGKQQCVSDLNECGIKDVLTICSNSKIEAYEFDREEFTGSLIGISDKKICSINPETYKYEVVNNSCPTNWLCLLNNPNRLISISEGVVVEYEVEQLNRKKMRLSKIRDIVNYGTEQPDIIELKRIKSK